MSWLLFVDESGHDHKNTPFEVRGGVAIKDERIWPFIRQIKALEIALFSREMKSFIKEIKGEGDNPQGKEIIVYHQTCIDFAQKLMQLLIDNNAVIFASMIPKGVQKPYGASEENYLRKDLVFLFERYFYFLERENEYGLIVMDETDKKEDLNFVNRLQKYFTLTANGRYRTSRIIPVPFFVSSDMSYPVQAADVCIYCINWGFRLPFFDDKIEYRSEIGEEFGPSLSRLQYKGKIGFEDETKDIFGIVYVPDPYTSRS